MSRCASTRRAERGQLRVAADQRLGRFGQVGAQRRRFGRRRGGRVARGGRIVDARRRGRGRLHHGRRGHRVEPRREAIAATGDRGDQLAAQHLAQRADLRGEVVLDDDQPGPDAVHQVVLGEQLAGRLGQRQQQVERAGAEFRRHAVHQQPTLARLQLELAVGAEAQGGGTGGERGVHGRLAGGKPGGNESPQRWLCSVAGNRGGRDSEAPVRRARSGVAGRSETL